MLKRVVQRHVLDHLDHKNLNDLFENSSCEAIAKWIWDQLEDLVFLMRDEFSDPTFEESLKGVVDKSGDLKASAANLNLKLYEIKLWEGQHNAVTYRK